MPFALPFRPLISYPLNLLDFVHFKKPKVLNKREILSKKV